MNKILSLIGYALIVCWYFYFAILISYCLIAPFVIQLPNRKSLWLLSDEERKVIDALYKKHEPELKPYHRFLRRGIIFLLISSIIYALFYMIFKYIQGVFL